MNLRHVALLSMVVGLSACSRKGCDRAQLDKLEQVLNGPDLDAETREQLVLEGVHEACGAHLPKHIDAALGALAGGTDPSQKATIVARALSEDTGFMSDACPDFRKVFSQVATVEPKDKSRLIYEGCHYASLNLVSAEEFDASSKSSFGAALVGPALYVWLKGHGVAEPEARKLIRTSFGVR